VQKGPKIDVDDRLGLKTRSGQPNRLTPRKKLDPSASCVVLDQSSKQKRPCYAESVPAAIGQNVENGTYKVGNSNYYLTDVTSKAISRSQVNYLSSQISISEAASSTHLIFKIGMATSQFFFQVS